MTLGNVSFDTAVQELAKADGFIRTALQNLGIQTE